MKNRDRRSGALRRSRRIAGVLLIAIVGVGLVGCGSDDSATPPPTEPPAAASTEPPTAAATEPPAPTTADSLTPPLRAGPLVLEGGFGRGRPDGVDTEETEAFFLERGVWILDMDAAAEKRTCIVRHPGSYRGKRWFVGDGVHFLEVTAGGVWTISVEPIEPDAEAAAGFSGTGDSVSGTFTAEGELALEIAHNGEADFSLRAQCSDGGDATELTASGPFVEQAGAFATSVAVELAGLCFWDVTAVGSWTVEVS